MSCTYIIIVITFGTKSCSNGTINWHSDIVLEHFSIWINWFPLLDDFLAFDGIPNNLNLVT